MGLDIADIPGAVPRDLSNIRGKRKQDFFVGNNVTNDYYNKESVGGNRTGAFRMDGLVVD